MLLLTSKGQNILSTNASIFFDKSSVNLSSNMNVYIVSSVTIHTLSCKTSSDLFQLYDIVDSNIVIVDELTLANVKQSKSSGQIIYKLNILFSSIDAGLFESDMTIIANDETVTCKLFAEAEAIDDKLVVCLQNLKQFITDDYMLAFKDTGVNTVSKDAIIFNQKLRELLHNIFDLTSLHGTYKSLSTILEFFGYGDLLALKEYWLSSDNNSYKSSSISNEVLSKIDKQLIGYEKTNQMSLVYQINTETDIDSDGLPIYTNVLDVTDSILTKLYAIKRILEKDWLFLNTHIVDIIGEFQTVASIELNIVLNDVTIVSTNISTNLVSDVKYEFKHMDVFIERHNVIIEPFLFNSAPNNIDIELVQNATISAQHDNYFAVNRLATDFDTFDYLTRYYSGNFGLIELSIDVNTSLYQSYYFMIIDTNANSIVFTSMTYDIQQLDDILLCGIKQAGSYKITLYLLDWYGAYTIISSKDSVTVANRQIDIILGKYSPSGTLHQDLSMYSTFIDTSGQTANIVVDNISETLDIMTWDSQNNNPTMQIARLYESDFDQYSTWTNLAQLNSIPLHELQGLPLTTWGGIYAIGVFDIIGNFINGTRFIGLRLTETFDYETIELDYDNQSASESWLTSFIRQITIRCSDNPDSIFNKFTWTMQLYADFENSTSDDANWMLVCKSKESSYSSRLLDIQLSNYANETFPDQYFLTDNKIFSRVDANLQFTVGDNIDAQYDITTIVIDSTTFQSEPMIITNGQELKACIDAMLIDQPNITVIENNDVISIWSKESFSIHQETIGLNQYDIARGLDIDKILQIGLGSDIQLGQPFFAFVDSAKRINLSDTVWTLTNILTGEIVTTQKSYAFRWIVSAKGSYTLSLSYKLNGQLLTTIKHGCIIVH